MDARYQEDLDSAYGSNENFRDFLHGLPDRSDLTLLCFEPEKGPPCHQQSAAAWLIKRVPSLELGWMR